MKLKTQRYRRLNHHTRRHPVGAWRSSTVIQHCSSIAMTKCLVWSILQPRHGQNDPIESELETAWYDKG